MVERKHARPVRPQVLLASDVEPNPGQGFEYTDSITGGRVPREYIAPTGHFLTGVFLYDEPFAAADAVTFGCIWTGLALYTADMWWRHRRSMGGHRRNGARRRADHR